MMAEKVELLCFPGWACTRRLTSWCGFSTRCVSHIEQIPLLRGEGSGEELIPEGPWDLLTWSMGTWAGIHLSQVWKKNPPRNWIALSPFLRLLGDGCRVSSDEFKVLQHMFLERPETTLAHFCRRHGGKDFWCQYEELQSGEQMLLKESLEMLRHSVRIPQGLGVSLDILYGEKDLLVTKDMIDEFVAEVPGARVHTFPHLKHSLLYENDPAVDELVREILT